MTCRAAIAAAAALTAIASATAATGAEPLSQPLASWSFEVFADGMVDPAGPRPLKLLSPHHPAEFIGGVEGRAIRLDGYSTWLVDVGPPLLKGGAFTLALWTVIAHYPPEPAGFLSRHALPEEGFRLGLNPWGRWFLSVATPGGRSTAWAGEPLPKGTWVHLAATFDPDAGLKLYRDGALVAEAPSQGGGFSPASSRPLRIGRDSAAGLAEGVFPLGVINGLIDEVRLFDRALADDQIAALARPSNGLGTPDLGIPDSRFAGDVDRPRYHPMPTAGWTNEPHGFLRHEGRYHLFYQANPNGPYWARIRWGHLVSDDLATWTARPPALIPEPGFDQAGIWVGNTFHDRHGRPRALYTGVNGTKAAIGLAAGTPDLGDFEKSPLNPLLAETPPGFKDFRDPFVWSDPKGGWQMLIGSGRPAPDERGVALRYRSEDLQAWELFGALETGKATAEGVYWEVPMLIAVSDDHYAFLITTVEDNALARGLYWIGSWNGERFAPQTELPMAFDVFHTLLSPTFARTSDDRLIGIGIAAGTQRESARLARGWVHAFGLPREVRLCDDGDHLCQQPAREVRAVFGERQHVPPRELDEQGFAPDLAGIDGAQMHVDLTIDPGDAEELVFGLRVSQDGNERSIVRYWPGTGRMDLDLRNASRRDDVGKDRFAGQVRPLAPGKPVRLEIFVDHSIIDVFVNQREAFTFRTFPESVADGVSIEAHGGTARLVQLSATNVAPSPPPP